MNFTIASISLLHCQSQPQLGKRQIKAIEHILGSLNSHNIPFCITHLLVRCSSSMVKRRFEKCWTCSYLSLTLSYEAVSVKHEIWLDFHGCCFLLQLEKEKNESRLQPRSQKHLICKLQFLAKQRAMIDTFIGLE